MYYKISKKVLLIILLFVLMGLPFSCGKENPVDDLIPYVRVARTIYPGSAQYQDGENGNGNLDVFWNWAYIDDVGYRGIIVLNAGYDGYKAFERTAPYDFPNDSECKVEMVKGELYAMDPCSNTRYNLFDNGYPDQGPGTLPLKQYHTSFDGTRLYIYN